MPFTSKTGSSDFEYKFREEMGNTCADEGLHDRITSHMASLPLAT
jgi:hypothetical protein